VIRKCGHEPVITWPPFLHVLLSLRIFGAQEPLNTCFFMLLPLLV
jgi:hypothetical protein